MHRIRVLSVLIAVSLFGAVLTPMVGAVDGKDVTAETYARAEKFLGWNIDSLMFKLAVRPNWIEGSDRFWYRNETRDGAEFVLVDPGRKKKGPAFDHGRLAAALSKAQAEMVAAEGAEASPSAPTSVDPNNLPFEAFGFTADGGAITFTVGLTSWTCDISRYKCGDEPATPPIPHELVSPDGKLALYADESDLWVRPLDDDGGEPDRLTDDGEPYLDYGTEPEGRLTVIMEKRFGVRRPPSALWSPNSSKIVTHRLDQREVGEFHLVQGVPAEGHRPVHYSYRMSVPGDTALPMASLVVLDVESGTQIAIDFEPLAITYMSAFVFREVWWGEDGSRLYFIIRDRGDRRARLVEADPLTGETRVIIDERAATHIDLSSDIMTMMTTGPNVRVLEDRGEVIWISERDGWSHLYLYDLASGELKNQITRGPWLVRGLVRVDEPSGRIWFIAGGREEGRDPYLRHLYSANLDGSGLRLLSSEDADHDIHPSTSGSFFVDNYSRIDKPTVSMLRSADGRVVLELEEADIDNLLATGWRHPERFNVKAADGVTDIYGILIKPTDFDPTKKYPVLDDIYPGPQVTRVPKAFPPSGMGWADAQALAELGFVVFMVDGRGKPLRSKAFHDYSYRNLQSAGGLEDHIAAMKQLAVNHPYLDLDRVGIYGWSGGGFASVRAMLAHPDFYKVAVSGAGNHDQRSYVVGWGEKYHGLTSDTDYEAQANESLAANLKGKLLLVMPELDDNVHPTQTIQLIDALIKANRDFDLILLPGEHHSPMATIAYIARRRWDYFVRHLLGAEPPAGYEIKSPPPEYFASRFR